MLMIAVEIETVLLGMGRVLASGSRRLLQLKSLRYGSFRNVGVPYFGVLIIRILLFRVLY